ncbi:periplasmic heavy metal sensor [Pararhizobium sp. PWRC1-1]|uniref:periplasmic heavy metal sensor n=1 Tax=Pararhizobium sp. PWRC1-1 TaxID=2804566 RepID=UPI003CF6BA77
MSTIRLYLMLSVFLNIFLLATVAAGALWLNGEHRMIFAGALRVAGSELPAEARLAFRAALREARKNKGERLVEARQDRLEAARLLREPAVDQAAIIEALAKARAADAIVRAAVEERAVSFASTLSPEQRSKLADAIEQRARRRTEATP